MLFADDCLFTLRSPAHKHWLQKTYLKGMSHYIQSTSSVFLSCGEIVLSYEICACHYDQQRSVSVPFLLCLVSSRTSMTDSMCCYLTANLPALIDCKAASEGIREAPQPPCFLGLLLAWLLPTGLLDFLLPDLVDISSSVAVCIGVGKRADS